MAQETNAFTSSDPNSNNKLIDILKIDGAWAQIEGFPQPNWRRISAYIKQHYPIETQDDTWDEACIQWMDAIRYVLGPSYQIHESNNFLFLSTKTPNDAKYTLNMCENALKVARIFLGKLAWRWEKGKHCFIMFEDIELYYGYISQFDPEEGEFGGDGAFLNNGYCHSAFMTTNKAAPGIIHGITYQCLAHLRIPIWLKQGLAFTTKKNIAGRDYSALDEIAFENQKNYWNKDTIQEFWSGKSFNSPESSNISYCFAQILVENIKDSFQGFDDFVLNAKLSDAGESSAVAHLGISLNVILPDFLGEGDWTANPFAIKIKDAGSANTSGLNLYDNYIKSQVTWEQSENITK